jgi:DNA-directed RNA polymerase specialized sigma subunit
MDIVSELNLLVIDMSEKYYNPEYKVTTFIKNFPAKHLRQVLIYKYVNFTYDENRNRVFVETCSINSKVDPDSNNEYQDSLKLVEAKNGDRHSINDTDTNDFEVVDLIKKSNLSPIEKEIIFRRLGLNNFKVMTLEEIGEEFSLTKERIRLIEKEAKKKLKADVIRKNLYAERKEKVVNFEMEV